ncbi:sugar kinase [Mesorhizobium sp. LSHC440A00]|uniref:sugar kinase n=1 Tax=Mesorhizobium sp. LSHC440A00 TaxID=1287307 RepID=UPI0003CF7F10|nr:sugar kinase [Mesorhizobium sp. LSHC440A00]ESX41512.1 2-dehydro-3-deoxygluconokinase [Mesorhizobium sp. LSHC440A00]
MAADGVASIGECMLELSGQAGPNWRMGFAGDTFNTLWALHALSGERPATYVSIGIGASPVIPGARPGLYAITLTGAERAFTYWRSDAAARRLASDPAALAKSLENQALVYFSGITLAILDAAARKTLLAEVAKARAAGSLVAFDPNYRPRLWQSREEAQAAILDALAVADIALPTFPDEQMLFGDSAPQATAERFGKLVGEVVVKNGEEPALIATGGALQPVPAQHVATPVDTTGAGDSFNGGYLAARLAGHAPADAVQRAHRVAAAVVQVRGAAGHAPADAVQRAHRVAAAVVQVRGALAPFEVLRTAFEG